MVENNSADLQVVSEGQFLISGDLDFGSVPVVWKASQSLFADSHSLTIDLSGVKHSNSAGLALLIQWMRYAASKDKTITFLNLPEQMKEIARVCGVDEKLPA